MALLEASEVCAWLAFKASDGLSRYPLTFLCPNFSVVLFCRPIWSTCLKMPICARFMQKE